MPKNSQEQSINKGEKSVWMQCVVPEDARTDTCARASQIRTYNKR